MASSATQASRRLALMLATVAVSGLQVLPHPGCRLGAPRTLQLCSAFEEWRAPLLCTDVADQDIYGRTAVSEKATDVYGGLSSDFSDVTSNRGQGVHAYSSQHPAMPWTNKAQEEATGSGFSIRHDGAMCIVTNAHVVADATYVEVRKGGRRAQMRRKEAEGGARVRPRDTGGRGRGLLGGRDAAEAGHDAEPAGRGGGGRLPRGRRGRLGARGVAHASRSSGTPTRANRSPCRSTPRSTRATAAAPR